MLRINDALEDVAVKVLTTAFADNPGVLAFVKKDRKVHRRVKHLCRFCIQIARKKSGAYITSNHKGVALVFDNEQKLPWFFAIRWYAYLGQFSVGWLRAIPMLLREKSIKDQRMKQRAYYFWMLAVEDQSHGLTPLIEIKEFVFQRSREDQMDLLAETISQRTLSMYLRYGFEIYNTLNVANGSTIYFIRRPWYR